jgi:drug/metabolite transporter (DMT)-like permease
MVAQKDTDPTIASLLMSLESVFGAVGGYFILHEVLATKELIGCVVMFAAIVVAQIPLPAKKEK